MNFVRRKTGSKAPARSGSEQQPASTLKSKVSLPRGSIRNMLRSKSSASKPSSKGAVTPRQPGDDIPTLNSPGDLDDKLRMRAKSMKLPTADGSKKRQSVGWALKSSTLL